MIWYNIYALYETYYVIGILGLVYLYATYCVIGTHKCSYATGICWYLWLCPSRNNLVVFVDNLLVFTGRVALCARYPCFEPGIYKCILSCQVNMQFLLCALFWPSCVGTYKIALIICMSRQWIFSSIVLLLLIICTCGLA